MHVLLSKPLFPASSIKHQEVSFITMCRIYSPETILHATTGTCALDAQNYMVLKCWQMK